MRPGSKPERTGILSAKAMRRDETVSSWPCC
jgi:hypothetical protein